MAPDVKYFLTLLSRENQVLFDFRTADYLEMWRCLREAGERTASLTYEARRKSAKRKSRLLWHIDREHALLTIYTLTHQRLHKALTKFRLSKRVPPLYSRSQGHPS